MARNPIAKMFIFLIVIGTFWSVGSVGLCAAPTFTYESIHAAVDWYRDSAEKQVIYNEIFKMARYAIDENVKNVPSGEKWGIVLDLDDTVFDNSNLNWKFYLDQQVFELDMQDYWIVHEKAPALPGVVDLIRYVRSKGGEVSFVTDRKGIYALPTGVNLESIGLKQGRDYCQILYYDSPLSPPAPAAQPKQDRFDAIDIESPTHHSYSTITAYHVVAYFGDNILDFPNSNQKTYSQDKFGSKYFCLPNSMYGSWTSVEEPPLPPW